ncbi:MAG: HAD superfamily hydrolase (TIGR01490 family) [Cycloclasticus pugetii]|jgi:HAD superfamily hydrolase (TIGR01490 family)|uniref:Histidinol-phosphatase n=1 Tax=Cycloclasticus zancles 78-ME TaxID=1198232 RepID=S5TII0_9GAMM|nr:MULTISPECIES: HAD family hydrolase [Cycloclasticus]AFT66315.1 HAD-superfamily hydrolase subfamily IB, PSPase-like protein [Cycloclasticus sp. P1]AGS40702.1 Phosphoserine phosphatase [Cycloclasticus zancles 78-ME]MBV1898378.1 HAD-IB family hydrolase [Cycloclasticus sp.]SHJ60812.1 HAD-superfamily subfamily IB hydrolase, TIGR01490 [Cycloclasticus pugetii]
MSLAIFDLDNTLISDDSDHLWGEFLVEKKLVDGDDYAKANTQFYNDYCQGKLDIDEYLSFALSFLADHPVEKLHQWREQFIDEKIRPLILTAAQDLVEEHRNKGDTLMVITATNRFVTEPIVKLFGIPTVLATEPEFVDGRYTGEYVDTPCYQDGKVSRLTQWLADNQADLSNSTFYSDSHNDIPLLEKVTHPVAVDPDEQLKHHAIKNDWPIITLR